MPCPYRTSVENPPLPGRLLSETCRISSENMTLVKFTADSNAALYKDYIRFNPDRLNEKEQPVQVVVSTHSTPTVKVQRRDTHLQDWIKANPSVTRWHNK